MLIALQLDNLLGPTDGHVPPDEPPDFTPTDGPRDMKSPRLSAVDADAERKAPNFTVPAAPDQAAPRFIPSHDVEEELQEAA